MIDVKAEGTPDQRSAGVRLRVEPRNWTAAALRGLPGGGSLLIEARSDAPLRLVLVPPGQAECLPNPSEMIFAREMQSRLVVEAALPVSGDYLLLADNRTHATGCDVHLTLIASAEAPQPASPMSEELPLQLAELTKQLGSAFDLNGLEFVADPQAPAGLFQKGDRVILGGECEKALQAACGDAALARDALLFALMHAAALHLLKTTKGGSVLPEHLAAVFMILFNQLNAARRQAAYFAAYEKFNLSLPGLDRDASDPLHPFIARSLARRLRDPQALLKQLQEPVLVLMRQPTLKQLQSEAPEWADAAAVARALARTARDQPGAWI